MTDTNFQPASRPTTHFLAVVSLVLSILGLLPVLPLVGAIGGIVTGNLARKEITANQEQYAGEGTARAGVVLGWIGLGLAVAMLCLIVFALIPFHDISAVQTGPTIVIPVQP
jgi:hypothetical protein